MKNWERLRRWITRCKHRCWGSKRQSAEVAVGWQFPAVGDGAVWPGARKHLELRWGNVPSSTSEIEETGSSVNRQV